MLFEKVIGNINDDEFKDKNVDYIDEVLTHLKDLRDTWLQAIKISKQESVQKEILDNPKPQKHGIIHNRGRQAIERNNRSARSKERGIADNMRHTAHTRKGNSRECTRHTRRQ